MFHCCRYASVWLIIMHISSTLMLGFFDTNAFGPDRWTAKSVFDSYSRCAHTMDDWPMMARCDVHEAISHQGHVTRRVALGREFQINPHRARGKLQRNRICFCFACIDTLLFRFSIWILDCSLSKSIVYDLLWPNDGFDSRSHYKFTNWSVDATPCWNLSSLLYSYRSEQKHKIFGVFSHEFSLLCNLLTTLISRDVTNR